MVSYTTPLFILGAALAQQFPVPTVVASVLFFLAWYLLTNLLDQLSDNLIAANPKRREALLGQHGIKETSEDGKKKVVVGFFHPYW